MIKLLVFYLLAYSSLVSSSKIHSKIYTPLYNYSACILLTNATHQIGCTSDLKGNRGVLHVVNDEADLDWLVNTGPHEPYIPLLNTFMFTAPVMKKLMASKKISGVLVNDALTALVPRDGFSPDSTCPLDKFGFYSGNKEYGNCEKFKWNPIGNEMSLIYYGIPIFTLNNKPEILSLFKCYKNYNVPQDGGVQDYPLCSVEMKDFMFAAKDTPTCRRKTEMTNPIQSTYCDPLGDSNVYGTLYPLVGKLSKNDIIMAATRLDSTGFFHDFAPGAENGVTGIVTLLAAASALGDYKRKLLEQNRTEHLKPIAFSFFNGEVWDYIGSSRMVFDMERGIFPHNAIPVKGEVHASKVRTENIKHFLEVSQVGLDKDVFAHTDPISQKQSHVKSLVDEIIAALNVSMEASNTSFKVVDRIDKQPLPPASFQRFLRSNKNIAGVVLADHEKKFKNRYYNSRFDNAENVNISHMPTNGSFSSVPGDFLTKLTDVSQGLARALYILASNSTEESILRSKEIIVPNDLTGNLTFCLMFSANCPVFKSVFNKDSKTLPNMPMSRYISVQQIENAITKVIHHLLSYYTGEWLPESDCSGRTGNKLPNPDVYVTVAANNGTCVKASSYMTPAVSPAFDLMDYDSTEYSTWAESMWNSDMGIQMYLVADPTIEGIVLAVGIAIVLVSFAFVYLCNKKATVLFTPDVMVVQG